MIKFFADIRKYKNYIAYAARAELKSEVANSFLNWVWWVLEPLCFMAIYALVFSFFFRSKIENLTAFIFLGITMWEFFNKMLKSCVKLVRGNKAIVSKVYVPKYILVLVKLFVNLFKTAISFIIVALLMLIHKVPLSWNILWFIPICISFVLFTFGLSLVVMHFGVYIEDMANVLNIVLRLWFYATGIFYNLADKLTGAVGYWIVRLNPAATYISGARDALLYARCPNLMWLGIWTVVSLLITWVGITLIRKNENSYVKVI